MKNVFFALSIALPLSCIAGAKVTSPAISAQVQKDVEGYAIASCLTFQNDAYLKDQGDAWASVIIQRSKGDIERFAELSEHIKKEVAKGNMAVIRDESNPGKDKMLPILYCNEIIDAQDVKAAINKAIKAVKAAY